MIANQNPFHQDKGIPHQDHRMPKKHLEIARKILTFSALWCGTLYGKTSSFRGKELVKRPILEILTKKELTKHFYLVSLWWLKTDSNHRPAGYEMSIFESHPIQISYIFI